MPVIQTTRGSKLDCPCFFLLERIFVWLLHNFVLIVLESSTYRRQLSKRIQCVITIVVVAIFILIGGSEVEGQ